MGNKNSRSMTMSVKRWILVDGYGLSIFKHFLENTDQKMWLDYMEPFEQTAEYSLEGNKIVKKAEGKVIREYEIYIISFMGRQQNELPSFSFAITDEITKVIRDRTNKFKVVFYKEEGPRIGIFRDDPTKKITWSSAVGVEHLLRVLRKLTEIKPDDPEDNYTYEQLQNLFAQDLSENRRKYEEIVAINEKTQHISVPERFNIFKTWFKYMDENNVDMILKMNKAYISGKNNLYPQYLFSVGAYSPKFILEDTNDPDYKNLVEINGYGISSDSHLSDISFSEKDKEWKGWNEYQLGYLLIIFPIRLIPHLKKVMKNADDLFCVSELYDKKTTCNRAAFAMKQYIACKNDAKGEPIKGIQLTFVDKIAPTSTQSVIKRLIDYEEVLNANKKAGSFRFKVESVSDFSELTMFDRHVGDHLARFYKSNFQSTMFVSGGEPGKKEDFLKRILEYIREAEKQMMDGEPEDDPVFDLPEETMARFFSEMLNKASFVEKLEKEIWKMKFADTYDDLSTELIEGEIICASNTFDFGKNFHPQDAVDQIIDQYRSRFFFEFELFRFIKDHFDEEGKNWKSRYSAQSAPESPLDFISKYILREL